MLIIRLIHLKDIPSYEQVLNLLNKNDLNQEKHAETSTSDKILNSYLIKSLELLLTVLSFVLAIWGTFFLGSSSFE